MLLPGSINDQSWNATGYAGLMKMKELGYEVAYSENVPAADHVEAMRDYASRGFKIVIGHSGRFLSAAQRVGPEFPAVQFVAGAGAGFAGGNVMSVNYDDRHFGCQLGVLAARMSKSGKIGGVYALEGLPNMVAQVGSFRICAKQVRPDVEVSVIYIKDIEDAGASQGGRVLADRRRRRCPLRQVERGAWPVSSRLPRKRASSPRRAPMPTRRSLRIRFSPTSSRNGRRCIRSSPAP